MGRQLNSSPKWLWQAQSDSKPTEATPHHLILDIRFIATHESEAEQPDPDSEGGGIKTGGLLKMKKFLYVAATIAAFVLSCGARWSI